MNPVVAIGVPIYGVEKYIERCAISLFEQTYDNIVYYFVNDCTKDKSIEVLNNVLIRYPSRKQSVFLLEHPVNRGLAAARNTVIESANEDFIIWVDPDDWVENTMVEEAVAEQMRSNADIVNMGFYVHDNKGNNIILPKNYVSNQAFIAAVMSQNCPHFIWGRLIRLSIYKVHRIRTIEGANMAEDWQVLPIIGYYSQIISQVSKALFHYNCMNMSSYSRTRTEEHNSQYWRSFENVKRFFSDKDMFYQRLVNIMELSVSVDRLINYAKYPKRFYYDSAISHIQLVDKKYWADIPILKKGYLILSPYRHLVIIYGKTLSSIHSLVKLCKKKY